MKQARYIPEGYTKFAPEVGDYKKDLFECWVDLRKPKRPVAMFFTGKQSRPSWHTIFRTTDRMKEVIKNSISSLMSREDMKEKRKEDRKNQLDNISIGDILYCSWGYEQTNIDFYQVVEKKNKQFTIREIMHKYDNSKSAGNGMAAYVEPVKDSFVNDVEPIKKTSLSMKFGVLSKYDGQSLYCSWYA